MNLSASNVGNPIGVTIPPPMPHALPIASAVNYNNRASNINASSYASAPPSPSAPPPSITSSSSSSSLTASSSSASLAPSSGSSASWQSRPVSEFAFDLVHSELIQYWRAQIRHSHPSEAQDDPARHARRLQMTIESMGFGIGVRYASRYVSSNPNSSPTSHSDPPLELVKFICKDVWTLLFRKQIDKLQTNYKGIYVLHDSSFRWTHRISSLSADIDHDTLCEQSRVFTSLACGLMRGALSSLGLTASVKADLSKLPAVQFTIVENVTAATAAAAATQSGATTPRSSVTSPTMPPNLRARSSLATPPTAAATATTGRITTGTGR